MAIKYTNSKGLGKGVQKISKAQSPLSKSSRKPVMLGRTVKKEITYTGPQATCNDVASFIANCAQVQTALLNWFDSTGRAVMIVDHDARIVALENAGFITCTTLTSCPAFQALEAEVDSKITCNDLQTTCREIIEDMVGTMATTGFQVGIQVTYDDVQGRLNFVVQPGCGDFCNFVMACQGIQDMISDINDNTADIQAVQAQLDNLINTFCATVTNCPFIQDIRSDLDTVMAQIAVLLGVPDAILTCTDVQNCMAPITNGLQTQIDAIISGFCGTVMGCNGIIDLRNDVDLLIAQVATLAGTPDAILTCTDVQNCMQPIIDGINSQITQINDNVNNLQTEHDQDVTTLQTQISLLQTDLLNHIAADQIQTCADVMACPGIAQLVNDVGNLITDFCLNVANCITGDLDTQNALNQWFLTSTVTQEQVQDRAADLLINGVHTNITFTYNDASNRIDANVLIPAFDCDDVASCISTHAPTIEAVQDVVAPLFNHAFHTNITVNYDDINNRIELAAANQTNGSKESISGNGSNQNFTLLYTPIASTLFVITDSGTVLDEGADYTLIGNILSFIVAPSLGESIRVQYLYIS